MPQVEVFTPSGVVTGAAERTSVVSDAKGVPAPLLVEASRWYPLDGSVPTRRGRVTLAAEDIVMVAMPPPAFAIHAQWYPIELDLGPYHLDARLPTAPGFDPARALARPSGAYVTLHDVAISLVGRPEAGVAERPYVEINRYAVDRISSNLMLAFFFPGARQEPLPEPAAPPAVVAARGSTAA